MHGKDSAKKSIAQTAKAIRAGDRVALARAITLVESCLLYTSPSPRD